MSIELIQDNPWIVGLEGTEIRVGQHVMWAYLVPLGSKCIRDRCEMGLAEAPTVYPAARVIAGKIGQFNDPHTHLRPEAKLWAFLKEPIEPPTNEWGEVSP